MLGIVGTVPDNEFGLAEGPVTLEHGHLVLNGRNVPIHRGTPALMGAAIQTLSVFGRDHVTGFLAGDTGKGHGSRQLYDHLVTAASLSGIHTLVFHYLQPDTDWHNRVLFRLQDLENKPILIADAGFMYAAKMSGRCGDLTNSSRRMPGELAFLADEDCTSSFLHQRLHPS